MIRTSIAGLLTAGLLALCGCGKSPYEPVRGVVLMDGEPVPEASVAFQPEDPHGENATGYTDANGKFFMTSTSHEGVKPGKYKVRIQALAEKAPPTKAMAEIMAEKYGHEPKSADSKAVVKDSKTAYKEMTHSSTKKKVSTPAIYFHHEKTPLRAEVPQKEYKFELTKDAK